MGLYARKTLPAGARLPAQRLRVFTNETNKFLLFDAAGSRQALAPIEASKKDDNMRVEVTGQIDGDTIKVASLKLLP